ADGAMDHARGDVMPVVVETHDGEAPVLEVAVPETAALQTGYRRGHRVRPQMKAIQQIGAARDPCHLAQEKGVFRPHGGVRGASGQRDGAGQRPEDASEMPPDPLRPHARNNPLARLGAITRALPRAQLDRHQRTCIRAWKAKAHSSSVASWLYWAWTR